MSGHIFPVKAMAFVVALRALNEAIEAHNQDCRGTAVGPNDGKTRMVLSSPEVTTEIQRKFNVRGARTRLAFASVVPSFGLDKAYLEVYDPNGKPLTEAVEIPHLEDALANAVQVELLRFLLKSRGVDIPLL